MFLLNKEHDKQFVITTTKETSLKLVTNDLTVKDCERVWYTALNQSCQYRISLRET